MPTRVIDSIRRTVLPLDRADVGDGELLGRFIERRDESALAALVNRHGPMVWGVCRRLLNHHDAEDAFQAAFVVLVRKAVSVVPREMVGNWLYGVAHQAALQSRRAAVRRRAREVQVTEVPDTAAARNDQWPDVQPLLDQELSRLPDHYRAVIVLCELEGKTRKEAARHLGMPEGTVGSRLARARAMLAKRLTRRGVTLSGGALAAVLSQSAGAAGVPAAVVITTIKAANLIAAGQASISVKVATLAEGVLKAMLLTKLKRVTATLIVAAMVGLIGYGMAKGQQTGDAAAPAKQEGEPKARKDAVVKERAEKEEAIAWGKEVDGLQAGLVAEAATCRPGDKLKFTVKLRNVGKAEVSVTYVMLREHAPQITTDTGGRVSVYAPPPFDGLADTTKRALKPGETITLYNPEVAVESEDRAKMLGEMLVKTPTICVAPGKYKIAYGGMIQSHPKLTTGTAEFEVKDRVVWGKEANGLQAGLFISNATDVRIGGKAKMVVKLRNVGKETIKVSVWPLWTCYPGVVDAQGKRMRTTTAPSPDFEIIPKALTLEPGETVDVGRSDLLVAEPDQKVTVPDGVVDLCAIHVKPGTYKADCIGFLKENHTLATGTVESEVKPASFTAWGKEVDGVQAGLGIAGQRAYHTGETVKLVVRARNVGKKEAKLQYFREFFYENVPAVTDGDGKSLPFTGVGLSGWPVLVEVTLVPGKEIDLCQLNLSLRSSSEKEKDRPWTLYGSGKFQIQYKSVGGNIGTSVIKLDPILSKLATGKLELEVKEGPRAADERGRESGSAYPTADVVVQYRDESGREVRDLKQFRVEDAETVAKLASHFPGILGDRGSGPRTSAGKRATFTIKFNHESGEASRLRVAHVTPDYATWWWRDNTPYTGDRHVEGKDQLQSLMERLAATNKVDLK